MSELRNMDLTQVIKSLVNEQSGGLKVATVNTLVPSDYDSIELSYTGEDLTTVIYKKESVTVVTLNLTYSGGKLIQIDRS